MGSEFPSLHDIEIKLTLKGLDKIKCHVPVRAVPISPSLLLELSRHLQLDDPTHVSLWCLFLFLFFTFARKSQFMVDSSTAHSPSKLVTRKDICVHDGVAIILFRRTKTLQAGGKVLSIPLLPIPGSVLCPVSAYQNMIQLTPAPRSSPAFVIPSNQGLVPVKYHFFQKVLKYLVAQTGRDPSGYSSHGFRRGGATFAFNSGVSPDLIQVQGDWQSDCYKQYMVSDLAHRLNVSEQIRDAILQM